MSELLCAPATLDLNVDTEARVTEMADHLQQPVTAEEEWTVLSKRRDACQTARELGNIEPDAGLMFAPLLVDVLREELEQRYGFAADELFKCGLSREVWTAAPKTLATITGSSLVDAYEQADASLDSQPYPCCSNG